MQVEILPAVPLPGGVKVVPIGIGIKPLMAVCKDLGASPSLATNFTEGRQIQAGCTCPENRIGLNPRSERYRRLPSNLNP